MKLTAQNWRDRAEAWLSCADHLLLEWTDETGEREQGKIVSDYCRRKYDECMDRFLDVSNAPGARCQPVAHPTTPKDL